MTDLAQKSVAVSQGRCSQFFDYRGVRYEVITVPFTDDEKQRRSNYGKDNREHLHVFLWPTNTPYNIETRLEDVKKISTSDVTQKKVTYCSDEPTGTWDQPRVLFELGWDFQHLWDTYDQGVESICRFAEDTIDVLCESGVVIEETESL